MTDQLFQAGLSNVLVSLVLAIVALIVGGTMRRPQLAHLLWLLVFVKLLTPPLVSIPVTPFTGLSAVTEVSSFQRLDDAQTTGDTNNAYFSTATWSSILADGKAILFLIWLPGSALVFIWSLVRVYRFNRLLNVGSAVASPELQRVAEKIAGRLGLTTLPEICTTYAFLSPMVWWIGGRVRVVLPVTLLDRMESDQFKWILAHELAHVQRRDYLVRWVEWLTAVCFWWNPIVWLARHHLRANEEICCDHLVISSLNPQPKAYANSLLAAVECLSLPAHCPPAMASQFNSYGFLKRRFQMIVSKTSNRPSSRWLRAGVLIFAVVVLPLGLTYAANTDNEQDSIARKVKRLETDILRDDKVAEEKAKDRTEREEKRIDMADTDGDGKVSDKEERAATLERQAKLRAKDEEARDRKERQAKLRTKIDTDRDGTISYQEALDALDWLQEDYVDRERRSGDEEKARGERQAERRASIDTDGDGRISDREERDATLERRIRREGANEREGNISTDEAGARELRLVRRAADTNRDGKISEDEVRAYAERLAKRRAGIEANGDGRISDEEGRAARQKETEDKP